MNIRISSDWAAGRSTFKYGSHCGPQEIAHVLVSWRIAGIPKGSEKDAKQYFQDVMDDGSHNLQLSNCSTYLVGAIDEMHYFQDASKGMWHIGVQFSQLLTADPSGVKFPTI